MMTIIYILNTPSLSDAVLTAKDIQGATGMQPAIISNGVYNYKFNEPDAARVSASKMTDEEYAGKNVII
ncbi:MAG: hypothetical protein VB048_06180 [Bacteroidaceae bacterium]|nr:hypothetical protein [Bacteroidaceae bacterium]MEA4975997.1 hypothetical protein [Paludibacter sp.]